MHGVIVAWIFVCVFVPFLTAECDHCEAANVEKVKLAYTIVDPPEDARRILPPIIMLHGLSDNRLTWIRVAPDIAKATGRRVYLLDARNHGDSPWSDDFSFDVLVDDVDSFMEDNDIPLAVLIGHSMGGRTAINLALKKPERVEMLVSEDMSITDTKVDPEFGSFLTQALAGLFQVTDVIPAGVDELTAKGIVVDAMLKWNKMGEVTESRDDILKRIAIKLDGDRWVWKGNIKLYGKIIDEINIVEPKYKEPFLGKALFLYGNTSPFGVGEDEANIEKYFPNAELEGIENTGHLIHNPRPEVFIDYVVKFILDL